MSWHDKPENKRIYQSWHGGPVPGPSWTSTCIQHMPNSPSTAGSRSSGSTSYAPPPKKGFLASVGNAVGRFVTSPGFIGGVAVAAGYLAARRLDQKANQVPEIDSKK